VERKWSREKRKEERLKYLPSGREDREGRRSNLVSVGQRDSPIT
jgi:hypothetical protein